MPSVDHRHLPTPLPRARLRAVALASLLGLAGLQTALAQGTWQTTLQGRNLDGNAANGFEAYYDTVLGITWLASVPLAQFTWADARSWAASLDVHGVTGWRLPTIQLKGGLGCALNGSTDCGYNSTSTASELAHMYYVTLGNAGYLTPDAQLTNSGFRNAGPFGLLAGIYWLDPEFSFNNGAAWSFGITTFGQFAGLQDAYPKGNSLRVWAVRSGDVAAPVPEPATWVMALGGLLAIGAMLRRRHAA